MEGCLTLSSNVEKISANSLRLTQIVECSANEYHSHSGVQATIVDTLAVISLESVSMAAAIDWNMSVSSNASFLWTAPVLSNFKLANLSGLRYWAGGVAGSTGISADFNPLGLRDLDWCGRGKRCTMPYGGAYAVVQEGIPGEIWAPALALPVFSAINPADDIGFSVVQSPETVAVGAELSSSLSGPPPPPGPSPGECGLQVQ
jgi:hypothetical protein